MTTNQIQYHVLGETARHNLATETETHRSNMVNEQISRDTLGEAIRSNKAREYENRRHDVTTERETSRSNRAAERENRRSNKARERENRRSNKAREKETNRANKASEAITTQSNLANQALTDKKIRWDAELRNRQIEETHRANVRAEGLRRIESDIKAGDLRMGFQNLSEIIRHNKKQESLTQFNDFTRNAISAANTLVTAVKNSRDYKLASAETKAKINKSMAEIEKIDAEAKKLDSEAKTNNTLLPFKKGEAMLNGLTKSAKMLEELIAFAVTKSVK